MCIKSPPSVRRSGVAEMQGSSVFKWLSSCCVSSIAAAHVPVHHWTGSAPDTLTTYLPFFFLFFSSCGNSCPSECKVSIHFSSHRCFAGVLAHACDHSSWKVEAKNCQESQVIPGYTELSEIAWALTQNLKSLLLGTRHIGDQNV